MSMDSPGDAQASAASKGKLRATDVEDGTETTPLLDRSASLIQDDDSPAIRSQRRRRLLTLLLTVFLSSLGLCLVIVLVAALIAYSYSSRVSNVLGEDVLERALVVRGPTRLDVLNATEGTLWVQVDGLVGIDAGVAMDAVLDTQEVDEDRIDFGFVAFKRFIGSWVLRRVDRISVNMSEIVVRAPGVAGDESIFLASILAPPLSLPLTVEPPPDLTWLTPISLPIRLEATQNVTDLSAFARKSWKDGVLDVQAQVERVMVHGGSVDERGWRKNLKMQHDSLHLRLKYQSTSC